MLLSISEYLNTNKVDGALNIPHTKITKELGIPARKVTDKTLDRQIQVRMC
jgi:hypothetical protein